MSAIAVSNPSTIPENTNIVYIGRRGCGRTKPMTADEKWASDAKEILAWFRETPLGHDRMFAEGRKYSALYDEYNKSLESENPKWIGQPLSSEYVALCNKEYLNKCIYHQNRMAEMKMKIKSDKRNKIT